MDVLELFLDDDVKPAEKPVLTPIEVNPEESGDLELLLHEFKSEDPQVARDAFVALTRLLKR